MRDAPAPPQASPPPPHPGRRIPKGKGLKAQPTALEKILQGKSDELSVEIGVLDHKYGGDPLGDRLVEILQLTSRLTGTNREETLRKIIQEDAILRGLRSKGITGPGDGKGGSLSVWGLNF
ncbi:hypothetical protein MBM_06339 [Drepanopeziza brunnea f. sp. 'multigermtubi' MB_m1]|uniref:Uncharacterized protein n=2 Tax=Drepanopeziza brunnea f. sp. 'multigermtubi' TaxID=698441 RepID=K1WRR4_MARBU|nr:uncharacterized protein MBM_06339 [Drepanopeziza brunnea f. sp. 'multigermtubi' MB_m1]EKD15711.1 hypothetical protein MBM_06339 [Drepanopeziza brunnea f. sp. 'multigermtubi' MB_m1]